MNKIIVIIIIAISLIIIGFNIGWHSKPEPDKEYHPKYFTLGLHGFEYSIPIKPGFTAKFRFAEPVTKLEITLPSDKKGILRETSKNN